MLSSIFGSDTSPAVQYVIAFAIIFVLLSVFAVVLRRLTSARLAGGGGVSQAPTHEGNRSRQPRLGIVDIYELDRQRRLILLRRDNAEHLLLIGGPNDVVVETNIPRANAARNAPAAGDAHPERFDPAFELQTPARPVIEAQRTAPQVPGGRPEDGAGRAAPDDAAHPLTENGPPPAEPPRRRGVTGGGRMLGGSGPAVAPASGTGAPMPAPRPAPRPELRPRPEPPRESGRSADPAVLSDMAKQLEEALRRPRPAATPLPSPVPDEAVGAPAPAVVAALAPEIVVAPEPAPPPFPEPIPVAAPAPVAEPAPAREPSPPAPVTAQAPVVLTAAAAPAPSHPPDPQPMPEPAPPILEHPAPPAALAPEVIVTPAPVPEAPAPVPPPTAKVPEPPPAPAQPPKASVRDPFSVEEIEAEFARLLGRPFEKADR